MHRLQMTEGKSLPSATEFSHRKTAFVTVGVGCVTGYQVIRVIRIFAKTYPFE